MDDKVLANFTGEPHLQGYHWIPDRFHGRDAINAFPLLYMAVLNGHIQKYIGLENWLATH